MASGFGFWCGVVMNICSHADKSAEMQRSIITENSFCVPFWLGAGMKSSESLANAHHWTCVSACARAVVFNMAQYAVLYASLPSNGHDRWLRIMNQQTKYSDWPFCHRKMSFVFGFWAHRPPFNVCVFLDSFRIDRTAHFARETHQRERKKKTHAQPPRTRWPTEKLSVTRDAANKNREREREEGREVGS